MDIVSRAEWGAQFRAGFGSAPTASEVWLHHSVTAAPDLVPPFTDEYAAMRTLERIGQERFGGGVSYTFAVMPNGRVYEGTGAGRRGAHTGGRNTIARAIVLVGDYSRQPPTEAQVQSVAALLKYGEGREGYWNRAALAGGHRDAPGASTSCPGNAAYACIPRINALAASDGPSAVLAAPVRVNTPTTPGTAAAVLSQIGASPVLIPFLVKSGEDQQYVIYNAVKNVFVPASAGEINLLRVKFDLPLNTLAPAEREAILAIGRR